MMIDSWDCRSNQYVAIPVVQTQAPSYNVSFYQSTLRANSGLTHRIRRQFERMAPSQERLGRLDEIGDELDLDAAIDMVADLRRGEQPDTRVWRRKARAERSVAVGVLVDCSNSTGGKRNREIRRGLSYFAEALRTTGDTLGIYGYSTQDWDLESGVLIEEVKGFDEPWSIGVESRIGSIRDRALTPTGPAVRYLSSAIQATAARTKVALLLTDGLPQHHDSSIFTESRRRYAAMDARDALLSATRQAIRTFSISLLSSEASEFLDGVYGVHNVAVNSAEALSATIVDLYRRIAF